MSVSKQIPRNIKRVARSLGYALWLGPDIERWIGVSLVLRARLTPQERAVIAWAALKALSDKDAHMVATAALQQTSSAPIAPLLNHMDEASHWADWTEPEALEAYCLASFTRMAPTRQKEFLDYAQKAKINSVSKSKRDQWHSDKPRPEEVSAAMVRAYIEAENAAHAAGAIS